jgi:MscS family membrane protein
MGLANQARMRAVPRGLALSLVIALAPLPALAADDTPAESPREATWEFLDRVHRGDLKEAATYLALPSAKRDRAADLARRLGAVLDSSASLDIDDLSAEAEGDRDDRLGARTEEIAQVARRDGKSEPVRLERVEVDGKQRWRFTASTVARVDGWYDEIQPGRLAAWMPPFLRAAGPYGVQWWQWIGLLAMVIAGFTLGRLLGGATVAIATRIARKKSNSFDDDVIRAGAGPLTAFWSLLAMRAAVPLLELHAQASVMVSGAISVGIFVVFFWTLTRAVDVFCMLAARSRWARQSPASRSLISLARRVLKVVIVVIGAVSLLSAFGYPVASIIAGLGVGGVAVALAAQKTVENLFGAFSIGVDQPIREGDYIKVEDLSGTVESIGLRSTRIRTLDRTLVTIPNGKLADLRLETFAVRDRLRLACVLGLVYSTTGEQLTAIIEQIRTVLREHPRIWPDSINVYLIEMAETSLKIEVNVWFQTVDWDEFQQIRQELFIRFLDIVRSNGSDFAYPPRGLEVTGAVAAALVGQGGEPPRRAPTVPS